MNFVQTPTSTHIHTHTHIQETKTDTHIQMKTIPLQKQIGGGHIVRSTFSQAISLGQCSEHLFRVYGRPIFVTSKCVPSENSFVIPPAANTRIFLPCCSYSFIMS